MFASGRVRIDQNETPLHKMIKGETSRINQFQDDMVNCGTLRGFKHFMTQVRSRDELLIKLFKDSFNSQSTSESEPNSPDVNSGFSSSNKNLPDANIRTHRELLSDTQSLSPKKCFQKHPDKARKVC
ncbi:hypothetical protein DSO57_1011948 [Entomophthora muscae]|uniref:Uncharacterized protein n=1 Tax=Entomophthora muscae TaxID=34485 RepID=A0ACC2U3W7_9FUNG|nr:hypothetical protein DSO57_1011948 [Entomophthora muscae]